MTALRYELGSATIARKRKFPIFGENLSGCLQARRGPEQRLQGLPVTAEVSQGPHFDVSHRFPGALEKTIRIGKYGAFW
jgi:hypothetical protein